MKWFDFPSIRSHLLVLVCLAPLPAVGLVIYNASIQYRAGVAEARESALRAARLAAVSQKQLMNETQHLLDAWAKLPSIARAQPSQCNAFLSELLQGSPKYANFGLIRHDGQLICAGLPFKPPVDMKGRSFFQRSMRTKAFVVGDYEVGVLSGKPSLYLAQPLIDEAGKLRAVLYAALDLSFVNRLLVDSMPQSNAVVVLFNSSGVILGEHPDSGKQVGKSLPDAPLVRAALDKKGEGVAEVAGLDGVRRLYAFTTLSKSSEQDVFLTVTIGIPTEEAFASARQDLYRQATVLGATVLLILAIIWVGADRLILRRLLGLIKAAEAMRAGNLGARSGVPPRQDELGQLASTFDGMAAALEGREAERAVSILEIKHLNEALEERVEERTRQLETAQTDLQQANERLTNSLKVVQRQSRETSRLAAMSGLLQACRTVDEAYSAVAQFAQELFPGQSGALFITQPTRDLLAPCVVWGDISAEEQVFPPEDCWALRGGKPYSVDDLHAHLRCHHVREPAPPSYMCVPLAAHGETMGILHLRNTTTLDKVDMSVAEKESAAQLQLAENVAERAALAIASLRLQERLLTQSTHDSLTNVYNRRYMEEAMEREELRAQRASQAVGIIMFDIDYFKAFNDTYGHAAGDMLLHQLGEILHKSTRGGDIPCRYGGEEFVVIMPGASAETTRQRAEELRQAVATLELEYAGKALVPVTISLGIAIFPVHGRSWKAALQAADAALYRAKAEGRNRVVAASPQTEGTGPETH